MRQGTTTEAVMMRRAVAHIYVMDTQTCYDLLAESVWIEIPAGEWDVLSAQSKAIDVLVSKHNFTLPLGGIFYLGNDHDSRVITMGYLPTRRDILRKQFGGV